MKQKLDSISRRYLCEIFFLLPLPLFLRQLKSSFFPPRFLFLLVLIFFSLSYFEHLAHPNLALICLALRHLPNFFSFCGKDAFMPMVLSGSLRMMAPFFFRPACPIHFGSCELPLPSFFYCTTCPYHSSSPILDPVSPHALAFAARNPLARTQSSFEIARAVQVWPPLFRVYLFLCLSSF